MISISVLICYWMNHHKSVYLCLVSLEQMWINWCWCILLNTITCNGFLIVLIFVNFGWNNVLSFVNRYNSFIWRIILKHLKFFMNFDDDGALMVLKYIYPWKVLLCYVFLQKLKLILTQIWFTDMWIGIDNFIDETTRICLRSLRSIGKTQREWLTK